MANHRPLTLERNRRILEKYDEYKKTYKHRRKVFQQLRWDFCLEVDTLEDIIFSTRIRRAVEVYTKHVYPALREYWKK